MSGSVTVSSLHGVLEGEHAAARGQNPVVVLAVGDKKVQTKALKVRYNTTAVSQSCTVLRGATSSVQGLLPMHGIIIAATQDAG